MRGIRYLALALVITSQVIIGIAGLVQFQKRQLSACPTFDPRKPTMTDGSSAKTIGGPYSIIKLPQSTDKNKIVYQGKTSDGKVTFKAEVDRSAHMINLSRSWDSKNPDTRSFTWQVASNQVHDPYLKTRRNDWWNNLDMDHDCDRFLGEKTDLNSFQIYAFEIVNNW